MKDVINKKKMKGYALFQMELTAKLVEQIVINGLEVPKS